MFSTTHVSRVSILSLAAHAVVAVARTTGRVASAMVRAHRNRRSLARLAQLDDYMLRDIGITRSDLNMALSAPAPQDPSATLAGLARERQQADRADRIERTNRRTQREIL